MRILCKAPGTIHIKLKQNRRGSAEAGTRGTYSFSQRVRGQRRCPRRRCPTQRCPRRTLSQADAFSQANAVPRNAVPPATLCPGYAVRATPSQVDAVPGQSYHRPTLFHSRCPQVSRNQEMPPRKGFFQRSGEPKRTGYSERAKRPQAGSPYGTARARAIQKFGATHQEPALHVVDGPSVGCAAVRRRMRRAARYKSAFGWGELAAPHPVTPASFLTRDRLDQIRGEVRPTFQEERCGAPRRRRVDIEVSGGRKYVAPFCATTTRSGKNVSRALPGTRRETIRPPGRDQIGLAFESALPQGGEPGRSTSSPRSMVPNRPSGYGDDVWIDAWAVTTSVCVPVRRSPTRRRRPDPGARIFHGGRHRVGAR